MPYANNRGVRIYYDVEGQGPPLMLAHGGTGSLDAWRQYGYTEPMRGEFRLILFDARGHGRSDRPHEASMSIMADDAVAVLDSAGVTKTYYWGYSMGSAIGFDLAVRHASRFNGFILGGISPYRWPEVMVEPLRATLEAFRLRLTDPEAYLKLTEGFFKRPLTAEERRELLAKDAEADIAILSALVNWRPLTNDELAGINVPCLLYCGDEDPYHDGAKEGVANMPDARFVSLAGRNHSTVSADIVLPHVKEFLARVSKTK
jgi:pimeloyl-ACP methyl ester carboxylesterase